MVLIPSMIDDSLTRTEIVQRFANLKDRKFGIVALCNSFNRCKDWEKYGATIVNADNIYDELEKFRTNRFERPIVIVNRYDGIDLPDSVCRLLVFDSKPFAGLLVDRYMENCLSNSELTAIKTAQIIEQGMGRAVRGEKDYCAIILIGPELIKCIQSRKSRQYFSAQTRMQIEIGLEISEIAKEEIREGEKPMGAFGKLLNQMLNRDEGWKEFYVERMNDLKPTRQEKTTLQILELERKAQLEYLKGEYKAAKGIIQDIIDKYVFLEEEKGWFLQEMARIIYPLSKAESNKLQLAGHQKNRFLLKPREGMSIEKITVLSQRRIESIIGWIKQHVDYTDLQIEVDELLSNLAFGISSDRFEKSFDDLGKALGFSTQRPDKEWKEGPDNLWLLRDGEYLLVECKNCVEQTRAEISKDETGQMNNASAWFNKVYSTSNVKRIMIIPTKKVSKAAGFNDPVKIMRAPNLKKLVGNVRSFFQEFHNVDFGDISEEKVQLLVNQHKLSTKDIASSYAEDYKQL